MVSSHPLGRLHLEFTLVLIIFDPNQRVALLYMVPFIAVCYGVYYRKKFFKRH